MTARVLVYDRFNSLLCELDAFHLGTRSWCLSRAGDADLDLPRTHPKATETNFGSMNLVVITSSSGIPAWGGRVRTASWEDDEVLRVKLESRETLLRRRITADLDDLADATPGAIIRQVLEEELAQGLPGITMGNIYTGGPLISYEPRMEDIWDVLIPELRKLSAVGAYGALAGYRQHECWVDGDSGAFNWSSQRGSDKRDSVLLWQGEGGCIVRGGRYTIDYSKVVTVGTGLGNHSDWEDKVKYTHENIDGIGRYGRLEATFDAKSNALNDAVRYAERGAAGVPNQVIDVKIADVGGVWKRFWVGDIVRVQLPHYGWQETGGFDGPVRVTGIEVEEQAGLMRVIGTVWGI